MSSAHHSGGELDTSEFDDKELQMLFEVHTGNYTTIHEFEKNVQLADSTTYYVKQGVQTTAFQTVSQRQVSKFNKQPWETFWQRKEQANKLLIAACQKGALDDVS